MTMKRRNSPFNGHKHYKANIAIEDKAPGQVLDTRPPTPASISGMIDTIRVARAPDTKKADAKRKSTILKPAVKKKAKTAASKKAEKPKSVHVERSAMHVLARTSLPKSPKTKSFPFKTEAGIAAAKKKAWQCMT